MRKRVPNAFKRTAAEEQIHAAVIDLLRIKADPRTIYYHPPNGLPSTARSVKRFKERLGMRPGVADIALVLPGGAAAFLEIKDAGGASRLEQTAFRLHCESAGVPYAIARSLLEADSILKSWGAYRVKREFRRVA